MQSEEETGRRVERKKEKVAIFQVPFENTHELPKMEEVGQVHHSAHVIQGIGNFLSNLLRLFEQDKTYRHIHLKMTSHLWKHV